MSDPEARDRAESIKACIRASSIIGERVRLRKRGHWLYGCCPFHDDSTPSFWVNDEIGRYGCHGCDAAGDVIQFVMDTESLPFSEAIERLEQGYVPARHARELSRSGADNSRNVERARKIWMAAQPIQGTPAETYLAKRALRLENLPEPVCLRFDHLSHDGSAELHPTLIALIQAPDGSFGGIQRTYLTEAGDKLDPHNAKRSLGNLRGNAIRVWEDEDDPFKEPKNIYLCEGLEDGLSLARMYMDGNIYVAAGAGMMRSVELPRSCKTLTIVPDNDAAGLRAAEDAAKVFRMRGLEVYIEQPFWEYKDINEQLQALDGKPHIPLHEDDYGWARG